jgi:hypothetical protein
VESAHDLTGELVWDLDAGRAHGLRWTSQGTMKVTITRSGKTPDGAAAPVEQALLFEEEYAWTGAFE